MKLEFLAELPYFEGIIFTEIQRFRVNKVQGHLYKTFYKAEKRLCADKFT